MRCTDYLEGIEPNDVGTLRFSNHTHSAMNLNAELIWLRAIVQDVLQFALVGLYVLKYALKCIKSSLYIPVFMSRTTGATGVNFKLISNS